VQIDLSDNFQDVRRQFSRLSDTDIARAAARALNRAAPSGRNAAAPVIHERLQRSMPVAQVKKYLRYSRASPGRLFVDLSSLGSKIIRAAKFSPLKTSTGVTIRVGTRSIRLPGAFITPSGAVRVRSPDWKAQLVAGMRRRTERVERGDVPDYPIAQLFVPGPSRVFLDREIVEVVRRASSARFQSEFARDLEARSRGFVRRR
jgi:hypothetical protein